MNKIVVQESSLPLDWKQDERHSGFYYWCWTYWEFLHILFRQSKAFLIIHLEWSHCLFTWLCPNLVTNTLTEHLFLKPLISSSCNFKEIQNPRVLTSLQRFPSTKHCNMQAPLHSRPSLICSDYMIWTMTCFSRTKDSLHLVCNLHQLLPPELVDRAVVCCRSPETSCEIRAGAASTPEPSGFLGDALSARSCKPWLMWADDDTDGSRFWLWLGSTGNIRCFECASSGDSLASRSSLSWSSSPTCCDPFKVLQRGQ